MNGKNQPMNVCIVIPCYNEEHRIKLDAFDQFMALNDSVDFLFVNDGSTDDTANIISEFCKNRAHCKLLDLEMNGGKAEAIRQGVLSIDNQQDYSYVGFFDADLATPLSEIPYFITEINKRDRRLLFIMGTRISRMGAAIKRKAVRHYVGRIFATLVSNLLRIPVYDTQCGAKLIHTSVVYELFEKPLITKWLFDVELIARLELKLGVKQMHNILLEVPLNAWSEIDGSKLKLTDFLKAPFELFAIYRKYKLYRLHH